MKTTVPRRFKPKEVFDEPPVKGVAIEACDVYQDGQVFYVRGRGGLYVQGFCGRALDDIY